MIKYRRRDRNEVEEIKASKYYDASAHWGKGEIDPLHLQKHCTAAHTWDQQKWKDDKLGYKANRLQDRKLIM